MRQHFEETQHDLAIDLSHAQLFCLHCNDFIYDSEYDSIRRQAECGYRRNLGKLFA